MSKSRPAALGILAVFAILAATPASATFVDFLNGVKVGKPLPPHDLQYLTPAPETADKLLLIDFWATWCAPCRKSIPELNALHQRFAPKGLVVIGVSQETKEVVLPFLAKFDMHYPHAVEGGNSLHKALGVKALPYAILVDRSGKIVWRGQPSEITDNLIEPLLERRAGE